MKTEEIWIPIKGFEGYYEVSNLGRVRSLDRYNVMKTKRGEWVKRKRKGAIMIPSLDGRKHYLQVCLSKCGKRTMLLVHRLVAEAFLENPENLPEVNHKDENKANNNVSNLEWCDHKYNNNYGNKLHLTRGENNPASKYNAEIVRAIRNEYVPGSADKGITALSKKYGVSLTHVSNIVNHKRWGWLD